MKIMMVTNGMNIGGAETHVLELSTALSNRGHLVTVASPFGSYTEKLKERDIKTERIFKFNGSPYSLVKQLKDLYECCIRTHPDILHAHTRPGALISVLIGKALRIPVVTTAHLPFPKQGLAGACTCWGECVLAVSRDIRRHLILYYAVPSNDVSLIKNGIDTELFSPRGKSCKKIVHVSRLDSDRSKTAELLIEIAEELAKAKECEEIVLIGDGDQFARLQEKKKRANAAIGRDFVQMIGAKTDIEKAFENRPLFVGVSRAALEAMSCECPVVLCGNEGYEGILDAQKAKTAAKTNFCGRNRREPQKEELFCDLQKLLGQTEAERRQLGREMRQIVLGEYKRERMAETAEEVYRKAIRKKSVGIMICGYYGYGNVGDEAVLPMIIRQCLRHYGRVTVMSKKPKKDTKKYGVKCISRYSLFGFFSNFKSDDILIFGGGNLLQNQTSQRSLAYYLTFALLAKLKKGKVALVRGGIGALHGVFAQKAVSLFLKKCDYISSRTIEDLHAMRKSVILRKAKVSADGSLFLPIVKREKKPHTLSKCPYCVIVMKKTSTKLLEKKAALIRGFCQAHKLTPIWITFDQKKDLTSAKRGAKTVRKSIVIKTQSKDLIRRIIGGSQFVLTDRLHAAYFALLENRPFGFLDQNEKNRRHLNYMKGCFQKTGIHDCLSVACVQKLKKLPRPLSKGDHARMIAVMLCGRKIF
ncbi:MAG: glycosyltransferase [Clostridia bacterium]|nr:glycosyltransferase [Clostridia bacterium]